MMRRSTARLAKPKGHIIQRMYAPDFLGLPINKVTWIIPYNNMYPATLQGSTFWDRQFSNPLGPGKRDNRMMLITIRNWLYAAPTLVVAILWMNNTDWYTFMQMLRWVPWFFFDITIPMPEWAEKERAEELRRKPRELFGVTHKFVVGGSISIPGSEININV